MFSYVLSLLYRFSACNIYNVSAFQRAFVQIADGLLVNKLIQRNYRLLVRNIDATDNMLTSELYAANLINIFHKRSVDSCATNSQMNRKLLRIIMRRSDVCWEKFLDVLQQNGGLSE